MDSGTTTLIVALSVPLIGAISALSLGLFQERSKREALTMQVLANKESIAQKATEIADKRVVDENLIGREMREEIREDNKQLRLQISEQDSHMHEQDKQMLILSGKIDTLTREVKANQESMKAAEALAHEWQARCEKEAAEKQEWKTKYEGERDVCGLLSNLYEAARTGKAADVALLSTIEGRLLQSGYLQALPKTPLEPSLSPS